MKRIPDRVKVLIVDDSFMMRRFIARVLGIMGVDRSSIYEASNGDEALKFLSMPVDILFVDINMNGMNGFEVLERFRDARDGVKVVVVTMDGSKPVIDRVISLRVNAFLKKPFPPEELRNTVIRMFGKEGYGGGS